MEKKTAPRELGIWVFDKKQLSSIEDGLGELLRELNNRKLKKIEGVELAIIDIYLGLSDDNSFLEKSYECRIDNAQLQQLAHLGVDVRITVV